MVMGGFGGCDRPTCPADFVSGFPCGKSGACGHSWRVRGADGDRCVFVLDDFTEREAKTERV